KHPRENAGQARGLCVGGSICAPGEQIVAVKRGCGAFVVVILFLSGDCNAGGDHAGDHQTHGHQDWLHIDFLFARSPSPGRPGITAAAFISKGRPSRSRGRKQKTLHLAWWRVFRSGTCVANQKGPSTAPTELMVNVPLMAAWNVPVVIH